jgi:hypothetical protein
MQQQLTQLLRLIAVITAFAVGACASYTPGTMDQLEVRERLQTINVFLGGISRDIGVFWTTRTWNLTSHAIDSEIDEARNYIAEDLAMAQSLQAYGFVGGVGETTRDAPKQNLLGTPWWSDGARVVLILSDEPVPLEEMELLDWTHKII